MTPGLTRNQLAQSPYAYFEGLSTARISDVANDGTPATLTDCNLFEFAADGRFERVISWIDGESPLVGEYQRAGRSGCRCAPGEHQALRGVRCL